MSEKSDEFARAVETVVSQFDEALVEPDWIKRRDPKRMRDEDGEVFSAPSMTLWRGPVRLLLDPNAYDIPGADGIVDLYLLPPYDPVATLYLEGENWFIHSPFPATMETIARPQEWTRSPLNKESIRRVLEAIASHAVPSV